MPAPLGFAHKHLLLQSRHKVRCLSMGKRRPSFNPNQLELTLNVEPKHKRDGALCGIEKRVSSAIAQSLKDDERSRFSIAGEMSRVLDDEVTKLMLDAYASEARDCHNISVGRFFALISVTGRYDILEAILSEIGAKLLIGKEVLTAELGAILAQETALAQRKAELKKLAPALSRFENRGGK